MYRIASLDSAAVAVPLVGVCPTLPPALDAREFGVNGGGSDAVVVVVSFRGRTDMTSTRKGVVGKKYLIILDKQRR